MCFLDPPEIELETDRVHSGENKEAHLTCLIHGNPTPTVSNFNYMLLFPTKWESPNDSNRNNRKHNPTIHGIELCRS